MEMISVIISFQETFILKKTCTHFLQYLKYFQKNQRSHFRRIARKEVKTL